MSAEENEKRREESGEEKKRTREKREKRARDKREEVVRVREREREITRRTYLPQYLTEYGEERNPVPRGGQSEQRKEDSRRSQPIDREERRKNRLGDRRKKNHSLYLNELSHIESHSPAH